MVLCKKIVFCIWQNIGKFYGLLPLNFDKDTQLYVSSIALKVYSSLIGIIVLILHPFATSKFFKAVETIKQGENSIVESISTMSHRTYYCFIIILYFTFTYRVEILVNVLNKAKAFIKSFEDQYPESRKIDGFETLFTLCVCLRFFKNVQYILTSLMICDLAQISYFELFIVNFPQLTTSIVFAQFFLGILFFRRFIERIQIITKSLEMEQHQSSSLKDALQLSDELDKLSCTYNKLYEIYIIFRDFYGIIIVYMVYEYFQSLVLMSYYIILWHTEYWMGLIKMPNFSLPGAGTIIIALVLFEIFLYCENSAYCALKVCLFNAINI